MSTSQIRPAPLVTEVHHSRVILVVGQSGADARWLRTSRGSTPTGSEVVHVPDVATALEHLTSGNTACVVLSVDDWDRGLDDLDAIVRVEPYIPVLVISADEDDDRAIEAVRLGAQDVIARVRLRNGDRLRSSIRFAVERQAAVARRDESEVRYRTAFDNAPIGMAVVDLDGLLLQVNNAMCELLRCTETDLIGTRIGDLFLAEDFDRMLSGASLADAIAAGEGSTEIRYMRTDGRVMWGRLRTSLIRDAKGRPRQIIGQLEDVTAFRRAQQQLEELVSLQDRGLRYAEALSNCSRVLLMSRDLSELDEALRALLGALEASTITLEQNVDDPQVGAAARILREVDDTAPGHEPAGGLIPWSARPAAHARLVRGAHHSTWLPELPVSQQAAYPGTGKRSILEVPILTKGQWAGTIRVAESRNRREWQTDEIRLIRTAAEMIGVFWERQYAQERLEALVRSKDEFVASVSHELRTPLTTVLGLASELRDRKREFSEMEQHELVSLVADQATEVASIVEDLLVAARAEIDMVAISPQPVDLAAELDAVIAGLPATGRPPARVAAEHVWAEADPTRTRQVLRNLLTNAARYGGDHIEARVTADERSCVVEVLDDGPGIPPEHAARIFDPYHRAHDPVGQPASVGLGLTVARELARLMGGELEHRRIEGWTIFELRLPPAVDR